MIRLLSFILLFNVVVFAQLYERKNIEIIRGNDRILLFTYKGDLSNDTLLFGVKPTKELSSNRVISKISTDITEININYFNGVSTIEIDLEAYETVDLDSARYWYDLTRYHNSDTTTLYLGWFDVWASVTSPFDGTNLPKDGHRFFVAGTFVDSTTVDSSLFMWDEDTQSIITVPYQQYVGTILPDSIIYPNDTTALRTYSDLKYMPIDTTIGLDTVAVNDLIDDKLDTAGVNFIGTVSTLDSLTRDYWNKKWIVTLADTNSLKNYSGNDSSCTYLSEVNATYHTGGGFFALIDSTYLEGGVAFDSPISGKQWARIELSYSNFVIAEWWGAVGNGTVDDSSPLQKALTYIKINSPHVLKLLNKTYGIKTSLNGTNAPSQLGYSIVGEDASHTQLRYLNGGDGYPILDLTNSKHVNLKGFSIWCYGTSNPAYICILQARDSLDTNGGAGVHSFSDMKILTDGKYALYNSGSESNNYTNIEIANYNGIACVLTDTMATTIKSKYVALNRYGSGGTTNNTFYKCALQSFSTGGDTSRALIIKGTINILMNGCYFYGSGLAGIEINGNINLFKLDGCRMEGSSTYGVYVNTTARVYGVTITDSQIETIYGADHTLMDQFFIADVQSGSYLLNAYNLKSSYIDARRQSVIVRDSSNNNFFTGLYNTDSSQIYLNYDKGSFISSLYGMSYKSSSKTMTLSSGYYNNLNIDNATEYIKTSSNGDTKITGFKYGSDGRKLIITSSSSKSITIFNESDSSSATNRIRTLSGDSLVISGSNGCTIEFIYNSDISRWMLKNYYTQPPNSSTYLSHSEFYPYSNVSSGDTLHLNYFDSPQLIDSIKYGFLSGDSASIQCTFGTIGSGTSLFSAVDTLGGYGTIHTFSNSSVPENNALQIYFPYIKLGTDHFWFKVYRSDLEDETTSLVTNSFRWVDSNNDSIPNGWVKDTPYSGQGTFEITTATGFAGRVWKGTQTGSTTVNFYYGSNNLTSGHHYRIKFRVLNTCNGDPLIISSGATGQTMTNIRGNLSTWGTIYNYEGTFTASITGALKIKPQNVGAGYVILDDIILTEE